MNLDLLLARIPSIGIFFERTYEFWRAHIGLANITHFVLGLGVAFLFFTEKRKLGLWLIIFGVVAHLIAFLN